jgi:hypothetical protein
MFGDAPGGQRRPTRNRTVHAEGRYPTKKKAWSWLHGG